MTKLLTVTVLDKILDGKIDMSDLGLTVEETIQACKELEQRKCTREDIGVDDNRVFLQEESINNFQESASGLTRDDL